MILTTAVLAGLLACLGRVFWYKRSLNIPQIHLAWLATLAFLPQLVVFHLPATNYLVSDRVTSVILVVSQFLLLLFVWRNRHSSGFWILGVGLFLNFLVIVVNGGFMPISPETVRELIPNAPHDYWKTGERLGVGKDIVFPIEATRLWLLSDRFLLPAWFPKRVAFSLGDVFIFLGTFWSLWMIGSVAPNQDSGSHKNSIHSSQQNED